MLSSTRTRQASRLPSGNLLAVLTISALSSVQLVRAECRSGRLRGHLPRRVPSPVEERDPDTVTAQGDESCESQGRGYKGLATALEG